VDAQIEAMHAMHQKMMAAKDLAERKALMAEHERMMRDGMKTKEGMSADGGSDCSLGEHERMGKRMELMQAMLQMMMDPLSDHAKQ